jgi:adenine deaminase
MPNDLKNYTIFTVIDDGKIVFAKETEMRLATKEEIKNQEMKNKTYKYNL